MISIPSILHRLLFVLLLACSAFIAHAQNQCGLCQGPFSATVYTIKDRVTQGDLMICEKCARTATRCFACGVPLAGKAYELSDGRHYCERDYLTAVFDAAEIQDLVIQAQSALNRHLYGRIAMPADNVDVSIVDRVHIESLFSSPGYDLDCPNIMGFYGQSDDESDGVIHEISLLAGLTPSATQSTFIHELTHGWFAENIPNTRRLHHSAQEGFCELISYLVMRELRNSEQMNAIARNTYTRGQFQAFLDAHEAYGLHQVINWLQHGSQPLIPSNDIDVVRRVRVPEKQGPDLWKLATTNPPAKTRSDYTELELKGILSGARSKLALINGVSAAEGETVTIPLNGRKVKLLCRSISDTEVVVEFPEDGSTKTLKLKVE